ncbi:MAG TPA: MarR family transcriptional regulator [Puia sp.]
MKQKPENIQDLVDSILNIRGGMKIYVQRKIRDDRFNLTYEMVQVLGTLWLKGSMNQQQIADRIQKNKSSLTPLLNNLAKRGLILRTEHSGDRRNKIISLTKTGKSYEPQIERLMNDFFKTLGKGLTASEIKMASRILRKMDVNLQ